MFKVLYLLQSIRFPTSSTSNRPSKRHQKPKTCSWENAKRTIRTTLTTHNTQHKTLDQHMSDSGAIFVPASPPHWRQLGKKIQMFYKGNNNNNFVYYFHFFQSFRICVTNQPKPVVTSRDRVDLLAAQFHISVCCQ